MSEGFIVQAGTIEGDIVYPPVSHPKHLRAHFHIRTTPSTRMGAADTESFHTTVFAFAGLAEDLLTKFGDGDRVLVQGRMQSFDGVVGISAVLIALDSRSVPAGRVQRDLTAFELAFTS